MKTFEIIIAILFLVGGIGLIVTIIKFPKDIARGVFVETPKAIVGGILHKIWFILVPIWGPIWLLDALFKWRLVDRLRLNLRKINRFFDRSS